MMRKAALLTAGLLLASHAAFADPTLDQYAGAGLHYDYPANRFAVNLATPVAPGAVTIGDNIQVAGGRISVQGVFRGPWSPSTAYLANDLLTYQGALYAVQSAFISGSTFTVGGLTLVQAGGTSAGSGGGTIGTTTGTYADGGVLAAVQLTANGAAQKSANLSDLASAATARINLGLGTAATMAGTAFDAAGAASAEATRAQAAEALLAPLSNPTFTGARSNTPATNATGTVLVTADWVRNQGYGAGSGGTGCTIGTTTGTCADGGVLTTVQATANGALQKTANLSDLSNVATARTNLGLGSAALQPSGAFDLVGVGQAAANAVPRNRGPFTASTAYNQGDTVRYGGGNYQAIAAFTSAATFSASNWNRLDPPPRTVTTATDTVTLNDAGGFLSVTYGTQVTESVPCVGQAAGEQYVLTVSQDGLGAVTIAAGTGATLLHDKGTANYPTSSVAPYTTARQYAALLLRIVMTGTNTCNVIVTGNSL